MVRRTLQQWDRTTDVVVVGSGTALAAALAASLDGADTFVLEKSPYISGTTAVSGGGSWVPNSDPVVEAVGETSVETLMTYLRRVTGGRVPEEKLERYIREAPDIFHTIEDTTALTFMHAATPADYHAEFEGGEPGGRMIVPELYDGDRLGESLAHVRESPHYPMPITFDDIEEVGSIPLFATRADYEAISRRIEENKVAGGHALIAGMYEALLERDVEVERESPAKELVVSDGEIEGVVADVRGAETTIRADAVVIAAGGMEWDEEMCEQFLRGPLTAPASPPYNEGDGIRMGADLGAKLGNMSEAFWFPTVEVPSESWEDGSQLYRIATDRHLPGAIVVNEAGRRFADETVNYNDLGKTLHEFDPQKLEYENIPAYQIMDHEFKEEYGIAAQVMPGEDIPDWIETADTLEELAESLGIDPAGLEETVRSYNGHAKHGEDPEYNRGALPYGREKGDPGADHPNIAPIDTPPFYAYELKPGTIGTKGGLVTTVEAKVVDQRDEIIPGLYASSNSAAHIMGLGYAGGGATIGPNIVYGWIAGKNAAQRSSAR